MRGSDQRQYHRLGVDVEVAHSDESGHIGVTRAINLSQGGMQVRDDGAMVEDLLGLEFWIPSLEARILADAEVVYRSRGRVGLRFTQLPWPMRRSLDDYVSIRLEEQWFR